MTELDRHNETPEESGDGSQPAPSFHWRRRLLVAGAASPVIASLYSRAAFGQETISTNMSCSESARALGSEDDCRGVGFSAEFWAGEGVNLYHPNYPANASFDRVFGLEDVFGGLALAEVCTGNADVTDTCKQRIVQSDITLNSEAERRERLQEIKPHVSRLGAQAVAALQNSATAVPYDYTTDRVLSYVAAAFNQAENYGELLMMDSVAGDLEMLNNQGNTTSTDWVAVLKQRRFGV